MSEVNVKLPSSEMNKNVNELNQEGENNHSDLDQDVLKIEENYSDLIEDPVASAPSNEKDNGNGFFFLFICII